MEALWDMYLRAKAASNYGESVRYKNPSLEALGPLGYALSLGASPRAVGANIISGVEMNPNMRELVTPRQLASPEFHIFDRNWQANRMSGGK